MKTNILFFVIIAAAISFLLIPHFRTHERQRGRNAELAKEMADSPDFADGYRVGQRTALSPATKGLSPAEVDALSKDEFKKVRRNNEIDWRTGFTIGFQDGAEKVQSTQPLTPER